MTPDLAQRQAVTLASPEPERAPCSHPPARQYAWLARDDTAPAGHVLCVACCDCGAVLQGGALLDEVTP